MHVYITRRIPERGLKMLRHANFQVSSWDCDEVVPRKEFLQCVRGVDAIFCLLTDRINEEILNAAGFFF